MSLSDIFPGIILYALTDSAQSSLVTIIYLSDADRGHGKRITIPMLIPTQTLSAS